MKLIWYYIYKVNWYMKKIIYILILLIIITIFFKFKGYNNIKLNNENLQKAITSIKENEVTLNDVVPFEWERVYTFKPYTTKEDMESIIGFKSQYISETINEGMVQLIFVNNKKIVSNVLNYVDNLGYSIDFYDGISVYNEILYKDNVKFNVKLDNGILYLKKSINYKQ